MVPGNNIIDSELKNKVLDSAKKGGNRNLFLMYFGCKNPNSNQKQNQDTDFSRMQLRDTRKS